jgi:pimeloyl-ACP methyl ester carboxylesterase
MNEPHEHTIWESSRAGADLLFAMHSGVLTLAHYINAHAIPFLIAANYFTRVESQRAWLRTPWENFEAYLKLATMNADIANRAFRGGIQAASQMMQSEIQSSLPALLTQGPEAFHQFSERVAKLVRGVAHTYPEAIDGIEPEFGFHFENQPADSKIDETERFELYQVLPGDHRKSIRSDGKPILIIPPFVLGANILAFLPQEQRSYAHAFANQGIPTYIRVLKDIRASVAVQTMTPEDDARDTQRFCKKIKGRHGAAVTLNGYCQGGYTGLCNILSGKLDSLVDAFITCVSPMDGTRSKGLSEFLKELPAQFNDLAYGTKTLANGNRVADGTLMGWIYKLKSIESEMPLLAMWRDMAIASSSNGNPLKISKTAAALNYWLTYERSDLPLDVTRMSFASYNIPIEADGTLPVRLFDRPLNLKRLAAKKIPWLICYGQHDDLVEPDTALAPLDFIDAEVSAFPKGHVAIATSWSHPESDYALHTRFADGATRGPVRFQLDLQSKSGGDSGNTPGKRSKPPS